VSAVLNLKVIYMSLVTDFTSIIRPKIKLAISSAMYAWIDPLKETINEVSGGISGEYSRPMLFGDGEYTVEDIGEDYVSIRNITPMQGTDYGIPEVVFVEEGYENYHMPGPRPFMEEAGQTFADGEGSRILQEYLDAI
jgi:hypothetical protein